MERLAGVIEIADENTHTHTHTPLRPGRPGVYFFAHRLNPVRIVIVWVMTCRVKRGSPLKKEEQITRKVKIAFSF